jgi:hypothetical protein
MRTIMRGRHCFRSRPALDVVCRDFDAVDRGLQFLGSAMDRLAEQCHAFITRLSHGRLPLLLAIRLPLIDVWLG